MEFLVKKKERKKKGERQRRKTWKEFHKTEADLEFSQVRWLGLRLERENTRSLQKNFPYLEDYKKMNKEGAKK